MATDNNKNKVKGLLAGFFLLIIAVGLFSSFYTISAGERGILLTFSKPSEDAKEEGLHFKLPFIQSVVKMDTKTQAYPTDASAASSDLQIVSTKITVNYYLSQNSVVQVYKTIGISYQDKVIVPSVQEAVKSSTAKYTAEELITKRADVKLEIENALKERLQPLGLVVQSVSITDFDFSDSFNKAIEDKVTAEQNALGAKNKLAQVEFEAQQTITTARANAEAIQIQAQAIQQQGGEDYVKLQAINKWDGKLPTYTGGVIPFINTNLNSS